MQHANGFRKVLEAAVGGAGVAGVSVVARAGAEPQAYWVPESPEEPAFLAYSITKTFTAVLVLQLCEAGRLSLDERLARWFPQIDRAERITLRQLLNHTAGIRDYGGQRGYHDSVRSSPSEPWSFERFAAATFDKGLLFEPGHGWAYSNAGYLLLKRILEEVTGASYRQLVGERMVEPLELHGTRVVESVADLSALAPGASCALALDGGPRDVRYSYHPGWVSHGVVASTPSDLTRFLDALFGGRLLEEPSLGELTNWVVVPVPLAATPTAGDVPGWRRPSYGLGLMGDPISPWGLVLGHNGEGPCYSASAFHARDLDGASVCAMTAIEGLKAEGIVFGLLDQLSKPG